MSETRTSDSAASHDSSARPRGCGGLMIGLLVVLAVALLILPIFLSAGYIAGEEFCPDDFTRRAFQVHELPFFRVQIGPITREDETGPLEQFLINNKHISKTNKKNPHWDLVSQSGLNPLTPECDARILCRYLDQYDEAGNQVWLDWTNDHPELSKVLWPAIAQLARVQHYFFVPDLFQLAKNATDASSLQREINIVLAGKYRHLALAEQKLGHHEAAVEHFTAALSYNPQDLESLRGRATSHEAIGNISEATSDRAQADRLADTSSASE